MTKSRGILAPRQFWSDGEMEMLRSRYPGEKTERIAADLGRPLARVYAKAKQLGLRKTPEYLASPDAQRLRRGDEVGKAFRFTKGHVPANKGMRRPGWTAGEMAKTQFKKGQKPHTWRPIGTEAVGSDGYLRRKMSDTGYPPRDWVQVHRLVWIEHNGAIPKGHCVVFRNGDRGDIRIENLELITLRENMLRNTVHNLPQPLKEVIQVKKSLTRKINDIQKRTR